MSQQSSQHPDERTRSRAFKRGGKKPWLVEYRTRHKGGFFGDGWWRFNRYKDQKTAEAVLIQKQHCKYFEYRIVVPAYAIDAAASKDVKSKA